MLFDSVNVSKDIEALRDEFRNIDTALSNLESALSTLGSSVHSPTLDSFKSTVKLIASNRDVLLNHFNNIQEYLETVRENYDSF
ncbi:MAG: hypothetical protein HFI09_01700 [Bacilli bacterium]|nr:hypothetical protein [Bacilli bacterium]